MNVFFPNKFLACFHVGRVLQSGFVSVVLRDAGFPYCLLNFEYFENSFMKIYSKVSFTKPAKDEESSNGTMEMLFKFPVVFFLPILFLLEHMLIQKSLQCNSLVLKIGS